MSENIVGLKQYIGQVKYELLWDNLSHTVSTSHEFEVQHHKLTAVGRVSDAALSRKDS